MSDYLWDRSGEPDPDVARLEQLLGPLALPAGAQSPPVGAHRKGPRRIRLAVPAAGLAAAITLILVRPGPRPAWDVDRLEGGPLVGTARLGGKGRWQVGDWLETDAVSRARVRVGRIGEIVVEPSTRVRLLNAVPNEHRLALERGVIHARVTAPPRLFLVETPAALAADLGCAYTLAVHAGGGGRLQVTAGAVSLEGLSEAYVPAGASCILHPGSGPGVPLFDDAAPLLRDALDRFEKGETAALDGVVSHARRRDTLTLWHLLPRVDDANRGPVLDRLEALAPGGAPRGRTLALEPSALAAWRAHLERVWWEGAPPSKLRKAVKR